MTVMGGEYLTLRYTHPDLPGYEIDTARERIDVSVVHDFLCHRSYWSQGVPRDVVEKAIAGSLVWGLYKVEPSEQGEQSSLVGFTRVVTDQATFAWLCDVFILESVRGGGLGKWLVKTTLEHPNLLRLRRFLLGTRDAHTLYSQMGFTPLAAPERFMAIHKPDVYAATDTHTRPTPS